MSQIALLADLTIDPAQRDAFIARVKTHAKTCLAKEDGCLHFQVNAPEGSADRVVIFEVYRDAAAVEVHMNTPHMKAYRGDTADMVKDRKLTRLDVLTEI